MTKIKLIVTGGTFDKEYDEIRQSLGFRKTHLPAVLKESRCRLEVEVITLMLKDSLKMKDADRKVIANYCNNAPERRIVITHGTDTLPETARFLADKVKGKTIVLTGAMIPYAFGSSDGMFNLGCALGFVQSLAPGVYVTMNGQVFPANNVRKIKETGFFETIK